MTYEPHIYFACDGTGRTALGPPTPDTIPYEQIWATRYPRQDNGDLLYGIYTMLNGTYDPTTGRFTPGYGLPMSPTPFESPMSLTYRVIQWGRSLPLLGFLPFAAFMLIAFVVMIATGGDDDTIAVLGNILGTLLFIGVIAVPVLFIGAVVYVPWKARQDRERAKALIRRSLIPPDAMRRVVESHHCPICSGPLRFDPTTQRAVCPSGDGSWPIAP